MITIWNVLIGKHSDARSIEFLEVLLQLFAREEILEPPALFHGKRHAGDIWRSAPL